MIAALCQRVAAQGRLKRPFAAVFDYSNSRKMGGRLAMQSMFSGLRSVEANESTDVSLGSGFSLMKTNEYLLSARSKSHMTGAEWKEGAEVGSYLVYKAQAQSESYETTKGNFLNGMMALQVLKPSRTLGLLFYGGFYEDAPRANSVFSLQRIERRPPMEPGPWAAKKWVDLELQAQLPATIESVQKIMSGPDAERKNAFILLQLGLEHFHPLVAGLLWMTGLEAIFDSGGKEEFKKAICKCLGKNCPIFPDWHPQKLTWTVEEKAIDLFVLRNKLAHGADLRDAAHDKKYPVDLLEKISLTDSWDQSPYALLLSEAACYLLCQVLQKEIAKA
jgi:hypothetical protein